MIVHYRIGSLEKIQAALNALEVVHYRIGSLEILVSSNPIHIYVHYRIGSLENNSGKPYQTF